MPFVFTVDGQQVRSDDLTLDEIVSVERTAGAGWYELNPIEYARHARAFLVEIHARTRSREEAEKIVGAMSTREAGRALDYVTDDDRPIEFDNGVPVVDPKEGTDAPATT